MDTGNASALRSAALADATQHSRVAIRLFWLVFRTNITINMIPPFINQYDKSSSFSNSETIFTLFIHAERVARIKIYDEQSWNVYNKYKRINCARKKIDEYWFN